MINYNWNIQKTNDFPQNIPKIILISQKIWPSFSPPQQTVQYRLQLREILFSFFFVQIYQQQQFPQLSLVHQRLGLHVRFYFLLFKFSRSIYLEKQYGRYMHERSKSVIRLCTIKRMYVFSLSDQTEAIVVI